MRDDSPERGQATGPMPPSVEGARGEGGRMAEEAQQRARSLSYRLYRSAERARLVAAEGLTWAANSLRGSSMEPDSTARRFADSLDRGATYLRQRNLAGMRGDLEGLIRQYPAQALGVAFVLGLVAGHRTGRRSADRGSDALV